MLAVIASLLIGSVLILPAGVNPVRGYYWLFRAGFGCRGAGGFCALLTALQYATPLILGGLSAVVAFQAGIFSIGQAGQMILGAGLATYLANRLFLPGILIPATALTGGILAGAAYGLVPGVLKVKLKVNEVIVTLILNSMALAFVGGVGFWRIPEAARLAPLVPGTKLNGGLLIALAASIFTYVLLRHTGRGYEQRMAGRALLFARFGGIRSDRALIRAMAISGGLAGLAGAIEVLGVQYRFVSQFSAVEDFDGIIVALMGQLHPFGVILSGMFLGGIRLGALNGLQLEASVPRELGSALIALFVLLVSTPKLANFGSRATGAPIPDQR